MRGWMGVLVMAVVAPAGLNAQEAHGSPSCKAQLENGQLLTSIEFHTGYRVEGPWHVTKQQPTRLGGGEQGFVLSAVLDEIVEVDALTGSRTSTSLPKQISVTFQGGSAQELVDKAATVFCFSVVRARAEAGETDIEPPRYASKSTQAAD